MSKPSTPFERDRLRSRILDRARAQYPERENREDIAFYALLSLSDRGATTHGSLSFPNAPEKKERERVGFKAGGDVGMARRKRGERA